MAKNLFLFYIASLLFNLYAAENAPLKYYEDTASSLALSTHNENSHIKVFIPSLPYSYVMRLINGSLLRINESEKGWEYFIAYKHKKINELTYDFWIRDDVKFQDGTSLNADSVVENFKYFISGAYTHTKIHQKLKSVEKIGPYHVRMHLSSPYGMLLNDIARIHLYTSKYYENYGWTKSIIGENTRAPGPYGAGPYILVSGVATGLVQSDEIILKANPYYFETGKPYIETITIYTRLAVDDVIEKISNYEGNLDIAIIPFEKKTEIVNSKYAKLITTMSSNNFNIHMNLIKHDTPLHNKQIRQALNQAIDQEKLIKFTYKNEGSPSPFPLSSNSQYAKNLSQKYLEHPRFFFTNEELHSILNGIHLKVVTQDRFYSLFRGIEYQLNQYGVTLEYDITTDEKYVFNKLLTNRQNAYDWDLLIWGNDDWYIHPWGVFFALYTQNQWSSIDKDPMMDHKLEYLTEIEYTNRKFQPIVDSILEYIYLEAYMLSIPSPNVVMALNKEVDFNPSSVAIMKLWDAKITPYHWSIRGKTAVPEERYHYIIPQKINAHE